MAVDKILSELERSQRTLECGKNLIDATGMIANAAAFFDEVSRVLFRDDLDCTRRVQIWDGLAPQIEAHLRDLFLGRATMPTAVAMLQRYIAQERYVGWLRGTAPEHLDVRVTDQWRRAEALLACTRCRPPCSVSLA